MIIGNGMIARKFMAEFAADPEILVFASGVSNSKLEDPEAFRREEALLLNALNTHSLLKIVYFSTCAIYDPSLQDSPYILHKNKMEAMIRERSPRYLICRASNLVGNSENTATLINFLMAKIETGQPFNCWQGSVRNMMDLDDFYIVVKEILYRQGPDEKRTVNLFCPVSYEILDIIKTIEEHLSRPAIFNREQKGSAFRIPGLGYLMPLYKRLGMNFDKNYLSQLLIKYFPALIVTFQTILTKAE